MPHGAAGYLEDDPPAHHSGGDSLLIVTEALALAQLLVQLLVDVLQHETDRAMGDMQKILAADQEETQQDQADEQLGQEAPHGPGGAKEPVLAVPTQSNPSLQPAFPHSSGALPRAGDRNSSLTGSWRVRG